ncbi:MAG: transglycosylase SLT domain-containing protein [Microcoleaceae cyanobacterium]
MLKQRSTQFALLVTVAIVALLLGVFFPLMQWQKLWKSQSNISIDDSDVLAETVLSLAALSSEDRQAELVAINQETANSIHHSRARYLLAMDELKQGETEKAIALLDELEVDYPRLGGQIAVKKAEAYQQAGETEKANEAWVNVVSRYPDEPIVAEALYVLGKDDPKYWDQAIADFPAHPRSVEIAETRLKENPNQLPLLLLIARHGIYLDDYGTYLEKLRINYEKQLTPEDWEVIAFGYWEKQDYGKGATAYSKAKSTPKHFYRHARGLWLDGKIPESRKAYEKLIQTFPNQKDQSGEDAGFGLIRLARLNEAEEAVKLLDQVIGQFPRHTPEALLDKSKLLDRLKSPQSASATRKMLLNQYSNSEAAAQLRWGIAEKFAKAGNLADASQWASQIVTENPNSEYAAEAGFWVAQWAEKTGRSKEAKEAYSYILARYPETYYAWRSAVKLGWEVGDFTTVRNMSPNVQYPDTHPNLLVGSEQLKELYLLGQHQEAWKLWQAEFKDRMSPSVDQQYTDGLVRMAVGDNLEGIWMLTSLSKREDPEERKRYLELKNSPDYWQVLYPFPYLETIVDWSEKRDLNTVLVTALIRQESRFMPSIKSVVGATGLMQVMPETGEEVAEKIQLTEYSLEDVNDNVNLGTYYLDFTHREYNNNSMLAVASYNAGPLAVSEWLQRFGFNDADEFVEKIPYPETYGYVKSVFGNYWNYLRIYNPDIAEKMDKHIATYQSK